MDIKKAAKNTLYIWSKNNPKLPDPIREQTGKSLGHQRFILNCVASGEITGEKAHRWLGWAQGYLASQGELSLADCKYSNVFA